jgi:hypothetical protein
MPDPRRSIKFDSVEAACACIPLLLRRGSRDQNDSDFEDEHEREDEDECEKNQIKSHAYALRRGLKA